MEIDIISYTDEQFASMTDEQILEVENVQLKKNRLTERLKEKKRGEKFRLLKAGVFRSGIWENICAALEESYNQEVESLRDGLLFYLRFASKQEGTRALYRGLFVDLRTAARRRERTLRFRLSRSQEKI